MKKIFILLVFMFAILLSATDDYITNNPRMWIVDPDEGNWLRWSETYLAYVNGDIDSMTVYGDVNIVNGDLLMSNGDIVTDSLYLANLGDRVHIVGEDTLFTYNTIAEAMAVAESGDMILVLPGTYSGNVAANVADITIKSLEGWENTTLDMTAVSSACMAITEDNVTIDGFTLKGDSGFIVEVGSNPDSVTIQNCYIDMSGTPSMGISIAAAGCSHLTVQDNFFAADSGDGAFWGAKTISDVTIKDNYFKGNDINSGYAIQFACLNNGYITGNVIEGDGVDADEGFASGIFIHGATTGGAAIDSVYIAGNYVRQCANGIRIGHTSGSYDIEYIYIQDNIMSSCTSGIYIANDANTLPATYVVTGNMFADCTDDIKNDNTTAIGAYNNFQSDGDLITGSEVNAEQLTSTDDADVVNDFTAGTISSDTAVDVGSTLTVGTNVIYTPNTTSETGTSVADDGAITVTNYIMRVVGADADAVLDTDPAINDGSADGQMVIIQGTADANLVTIADNVNTQLAGGASMSLGDGDTIQLMWDSHYSMWIEISRSNN